MTTQPQSHHRKLSEFVMPYLVIVLTALLIVSVITARNRASDAEKTTEDLRLGLIANCEKNGGPVRDAIQAIIADEIAQSQSFADHDQASLFFPNVPKEQLDALLEESVERYQTILATVPDLDCAAVFPKDDN